MEFQEITGGMNSAVAATTVPEKNKDVLITDVKFSLAMVVLLAHCTQQRSSVLRLRINRFGTWTPSQAGAACLDTSPSQNQI